MFRLFKTKITPIPSNDKNRMNFWANHLSQSFQHKFNILYIFHAHKSKILVCKYFLEFEFFSWNKEKKEKTHAFKHSICMHTNGYCLCSLYNILAIYVFFFLVIFTTI